MRLGSKRLFAKLNPSRSLKARVGWVTVGTALILSLCLSLMAGQMSRDRIVDDRGEFLSSLAFQMATQLDRGLFERYNDIQILASLDDIRQADAVMSTQRALLSQLQDSYSYYAWIGLTDQQGIVQVSTGGLLEGESVAERPWFQQGQQSPFVGDVAHKPLLSDSLLDHKSTDPLRFVDMAAPVRNADGQFQGVLGAHLSWDWAREVRQSLLASLSQLSQTDILVLSADNKVLLGPDDLLDQTLTIDGIQNHEGDRASYSLERWPDGFKYLTGVALSQEYQNFDGLSWEVVVRQPAQLAFAAANDLQRQVFGLGALLGALFAAISWFNARRVVAPILKLTRAANLIEQGELTVEIPRFQGHDELAVLSGALYHLVQRLRTQREGLAAANQQLQADLIERQRSAQKISQQAALLDISSDAILVRDLAGDIQYWNRGAERIYGWSRAEAAGKNAVDLLNRTVPAKLEDALTAVMEIGEWQGELSRINKAGNAVIADSRWTLVRNEANEPTAILTVDTDITEAKAIEVQSLRAQRLESLGTLASGIAHDLNNVLTPIAGAAYLLPMTIKNLDEKSARLIENLDTSTQRASDMVKQILSFARGVQGDRTLVQVKHVLTDLKKGIGNTLPKNIEIVLDLEPYLWLVTADATQLHQVFMNLCINARDAMLTGGRLSMVAKNLQIEEHYSLIHPDACVGPYVQVSITDTGTGMPAEVIEQIFDPFFTTKEMGKGTGLGLSTSLGIVKNHGGFIQVYSQAGQGTTFHVYLPAQVCVDDECEIEAVAPAGQGELILVVDDEQIIREITRAALEANNYRVITASDGIGAISQYRKHSADIEVVLTDMMMPNVGGAQAIADIFAINPAAKIIVTSGLNAQKIPADVQAFLPKPYSVKALLNELRTAISAVS